VCPWLRSTDSISAADHYAPARSAALAALTGDVVSRLSSYYRPDGNYAGATFLSLCPNEPDRVTGSDLFAVTLLSVDIGARTTRRLLTDEDLRAQLRAVPSDVRLEEASADVFDAAGTYYETVKRLFVDPTAQRSGRGWRRRNSSPASALTCCRYATNSSASSSASIRSGAIAVPGRSTSS
jgi:hypothetical protein